ncbi:MAG: prefoldin subunit alpha [Candidatus Diapherotrites archaeon]|nr:prefoldin subunit alpha [Candidatus Diapherotrites archaeon]
MAEEKTVRLTGEQLLNAYRNEQARVEMLQKREQSVQQLLAEFAAAIDALKEIGGIGAENSVLVPLGAGVYAEARIADTKKVKSSLAGSVLLDKSAKETLQQLEEQRKNVEQESGKLVQEMRRTVQNLKNLGAILDEATKRSNEMRKGAGTQGQGASEPSGVS